MIPKTILKNYLKFLNRMTLVKKIFNTDKFKIIIFDTYFVYANSTQFSIRD